MGILTNDMYGKFTQVPNLIITDTKIKHSAFRQYCYLLSKPSGWEVRNTDIANQLGIAKSTISDNFKNLISCMYMDRTPIRTEKGKFVGGYDYQIFVVPTETTKNTVLENTGNGENIVHSNTYTNEPPTNSQYMQMMVKLEEEKKKKNRAYTQQPRHKTKHKETHFRADV